MQPILTDILAKAWAQLPDKPTARNTPLRYSAAFGCARQMGYAAIGSVPSNEMDEGDAWAPGIGTLIHEAAQAAIMRVFPSARAEVSSQHGDSISGSCDMLVEVADILATTGVRFAGTHVLWELKTMGEWQFDSQMGYNRKMAKASYAPKGPKMEAIVQAGINALGIEIDQPDVRIETILMGSLCVTAVSVRKARTMGIAGFERIGGEWAIGRREWEPLAQRELARMQMLAGIIEGGHLPDRRAVEDGEYDERGNGMVFLNPRGGKDWQCDYCRFRDLCISDGEGDIDAADSWLVKDFTK